MQRIVFPIVCGVVLAQTTSGPKGCRMGLWSPENRCGGRRIEMKREEREAAKQLKVED
jgi:hypothetical protein